ncbi:MAG: aminoacyl-tRNA hydrolase [Arsenophonus sp. NC-WZS1-MAG3]
MVNKIKLIVGLANPDSEYILTRHNAGAWYVELLAKQCNQLLKKENKFFGYTASINLANNDIRLLIPTTYMNLSGKSVLALANFYSIKASEILVSHDELDLMPGSAKIKLGGNNSGHNGLKDIQNKLGNNPNFYRLRIGIGHPGDKNKVASFVLNKPTLQEQKLIDDTINEAIRCTSILLNEGVDKAVNQLHTFKASN